MNKTLLLLLIFLVSCSESEFTADEFTLTQVNYLKVYCEDRTACLKAVEQQAKLCQQQSGAVIDPEAMSFEELSMAGGEFQFCIISKMDDQFQQRMNQLFPVKETPIDSP